MKKLFIALLLTLAIAGYGQIGTGLTSDDLVDTVLREDSPQYDTSECWILCFNLNDPISVYPEGYDSPYREPLAILPEVWRGYVVREYVLTEDTRWEEVYIGDSKSLALTSYPVLSLEPDSFITLLNYHKQPLDSRVVVWDWKLKTGDAINNNKK